MSVASPYIFQKLMEWDVPIKQTLTATLTALIFLYLQVSSNFCTWLPAEDSPE